MPEQKTLPMAMTVLSFFPESLGEPGLIAIPCIVSHLVQLFVDAFLAAKWAKVTTDVRPVGRSALSRRARGEDSLQLARHDKGGAARRYHTYIENTWYSIGRWYGIRFSFIFIIV